MSPSIKVVSGQSIGLFLWVPAQVLEAGVGSSNFNHALNVYSDDVVVYHCGDDSHMHRVSWWWRSATGQVTPASQLNYSCGFDEVRIPCIRTTTLFFLGVLLHQIWSNRKNVTFCQVGFLKSFWDLKLLRWLAGFDVVSLKIKQPAFTSATQFGTDK